MNKAMKKRNLIIKAAALACAAALALSGCGADMEAKEHYRELGISDMEAGDYARAIEEFQAALDESVGSVSNLDLDICYYKAQAQYLNGDYEDALETYTALINYNGDAEAYYLRGCLYYMTGVEYEEGQGEADFAAALEADPNNYELYIGIYEILTSVKDEADKTEGIGDVYVDITTEEIENYLYEALQIKGSSASDDMCKGRIYYMLDDQENALEYLQLAADGGETEAYYYLTLLYEETGDTDAADTAFAQYLASDDMDSKGLYEIGTTMMDSGDYDKAVQCFTTGLGLDEVTNEQELTRALIIAYEYSGDFDTAKSLITDYVAAYPDDEEMAREATFLSTR